MKEKNLNKEIRNWGGRGSPLQNGKNPLNPKVPFEKSYMTDLLHGMINEGYKIKAIPVRNGWLELDSYDDFVKYQSMFKEKTISKFFNV